MIKFVHIFYRFYFLYDIRLLAKDLLWLKLFICVQMSTLIFEVKIVKMCMEKVLKILLDISKNRRPYASMNIFYNNVMRHAQCIKLYIYIIKKLTT